MSHHFLEALRAELASRQKQVAHGVYPESTPEVAESRLSRVLAGEQDRPGARVGEPPIRLPGLAPTSSAGVRRLAPPWGPLSDPARAA